MEAEALTASLQSLRPAEPPPLSPSAREERSILLSSLLSSLRAQTLRDVDPSPPVFDAMFSLLIDAWACFPSSLLYQLHQLLDGILSLPEFASAAPIAALSVSPQLMEAIFNRLKRPADDLPSVAAPAPVPSVTARSAMKPTGSPDAPRIPPGDAQTIELSALRQLLYWLYRGYPPLRPSLRSSLGAAMLSMSNTIYPPPGLRVALELCAPIIAGFGPPRRVHRELMNHVLLPLHRPAGRIDSTTAVLSLYHEALVHCLLLLLSSQPSLISQLVPPLLQLWPGMREGNSSKEVLLLHELERLLEATPKEERSFISRAVAPMLSRCLGSENSRIAERALTVFSTAGVREVLFSAYGNVVTQLMAALLRQGIPHWNSTVNKMTHEVLSLIQAHDPLGFAKAAELLFNSTEQPPTPASSNGRADGAVARSGGQQAAYTPMRAPWAVRGGGAASTQGVAPWAKTGPPTGGRGGLSGRGVGSVGRGGVGMGGVGDEGSCGASGGVVRPSGLHPMASSSAHHRIPPLPLDQPQSKRPLSSLAGSPQPADPPPSSAAFSLDLTRVSAAARTEQLRQEEDSAPSTEVATEREEEEGFDGGVGSSGSRGPGLTRVLEYMSRIKPTEEQMKEAALPPPSQREHLTEAPTLLPSVIFQDLVFGADLGSGSFSTVRYCKHVQRGTPTRSWPEYAAKVIRSQLMVELGYEPAVRREIAILRQLKHPGVARLVSSFKWRDDVYLLLEFAARGDLHSLLRRYGSLDLPNARFIFAEVAEALRSVHSVGYAYSDLKPENIVLSASGHAKLTDFGAARPLKGHASARAAIVSAKNLLVQLRDGDWRSKQSDETNAHSAELQGDSAMEVDVEGAGEEEEEGVDLTDSRLEGTALYMSPELVRGGQPTEASDLWAFGCTLYQALCGKAPFWAESHDAIFRGIVRFEAMAVERFPEAIPVDARDLIISLMVVDPVARCDMSSLLSHAFFAGLDLTSLYTQTPPPLSQGIASPAPNASWTRRQNSMMWSPLPQARYEFGGIQSLEAIAETELEANAPFLPGASLMPELNTISEGSVPKLSGHRLPTA